MSCKLVVQELILNLGITMLPTDILDILTNHYAPLSEECFHELLQNIQIKAVKKGDILVKDGQYAKQAYFILQGCARAYYLKDGKEITDWFAFENEFISAIVSFFGNEASPHYIEVLEDSVVVSISKDTVELLSSKFHDFEHLMRIALTKTVLQHQRRISSILFHSAEERYEQFLELHPNITQRVALKYIASYIGISMETLSRVRSTQSRT